MIPQPAYSLAVEMMTEMEHKTMQGRKPLRFSGFPIKKPVVPIENPRTEYGRISQFNRPKKGTNATSEKTIALIPHKVFKGLIVLPHILFCLN